MDPTIPLVVSQVNPDDLEGHPGIIANPNCSTMQLVPVLMALRDTRRARAGRRRHLPGGVRHRRRGDRASSRARSGPTSPASRSRPRVYPHPIAFNALPQVDVFLDNGYTKEEWKVVTESRKILHLPDLRISCTAVRVPGLRRPLGGGPRRDARADRPRTGPASSSRRSPGVVVQDDPSTSTYPLATDAAGTDEIFVGRVRQDPSIADGRGLAFWVVSDNLRKGAATNAVQIAEVLVERGWVRPGRRPRRRAVPGREAEPAAIGGVGVTHAERQAALEAIAAEVRACTRCRLARDPDERRPGRGQPRHRGRLRRRGPGLQRGSPGPAVRRPGRRPARRSSSARSAGGATRSSSRTS